MSIQFACIEANTSLTSLKITKDALFSVFQSYLLIVEPAKSLSIIDHETLNIVLKCDDPTIIDAAISGCFSLGFIRLTAMRSTTISTYSIDLNKQRLYSDTTVLRAPASFTFTSPFVVFPNGSLCTVIKSKEDATFSVAWARTRKIHQGRWELFPTLKDQLVKPTLQLINNYTQLLCTVGKSVFIVSIDTMETSFQVDLKYTPSTALSLTNSHLTFCKNESLRTLSIDNTINSLIGQQSTFFEDDHLKRYASYRETIYVLDIDTRMLSGFAALTRSPKNSLKLLCTRVLNQLGLFDDITKISQQQAHTVIHQQTRQCIDDDQYQEAEDVHHAPATPPPENLLTAQIPPSADGTSLLSHCLNEEDDDIATPKMVPLVCTATTTTSSKRDIIDDPWSRITLDVFDISIVLPG